MRAFSPYSPPGATLDPGDAAPSAGPTRTRRAIAFALDVAPLCFAVGVGAGPALLALSLFAVEQVFGIGMFDPALGGDPLMFQEVLIGSRFALRSLPVVVAWTLAQAATAVMVGASGGKLATGLRVVDAAGGRVSRWRLVARELVRGAPSMSITATCGAFSFTRSPILLFGAIVLQLAVAFLAFAWSATRVLRSGAARSSLDVVVRTVVRES
jgi:hypothetical protein